MGAIRVAVARQTPRPGPLASSNAPLARRPKIRSKGIPVPWRGRITASEAGAGVGPRPTVAVRRKGDARPSVPFARLPVAGRPATVKVLASVPETPQVAAPTIGGTQALRPEEVLEAMARPGLPTASPAAVPRPPRPSREATRVPVVRVLLLAADAVVAVMATLAAALLTSTKVAPGEDGVATATGVVPRPVAGRAVLLATPIAQVEVVGQATRVPASPVVVPGASRQVPRVRRPIPATQASLPKTQAVVPARRT